MSDALEITMLPAKEGDCLLIAYGGFDDRKHILIDAGRAWTYEHALKHFLDQQHISTLELLVVTHVDRDHIDGMLGLIQDSELHVKVKNIWFNTWDHLHGRKIERPTDDDMETFGAKMGEALSTQIVNKTWDWNQQFDGGAVALDDADTGQRIQMGALTLTLLSPDRDKLQALIPKWKKECRKAGITPGYTVEEYVSSDDDMEEFGTLDIDQLADEAFSEDHSSANGSSIAFLLEYKDQKLLLAADAHPGLLAERLRQMGATRTSPLSVNAFKLPHHGSKYNISNELLNLIRCDHYLISTNGNYFRHPDEVAMARVIKYGTAGATLHFNYKTEYSCIWDDSDWQQTYHYKTRYCPDGQDGYLTLALP